MSDRELDERGAVVNTGRLHHYFVFMGYNRRCYGNRGKVLRHVLSAPDISIKAAQRRGDGLFELDRFALRRWAAENRGYLTTLTHHYPSANR